jgi:peptide/nickel transport system substrate-binding protein
MSKRVVAWGMWSGLATLGVALAVASSGCSGSPQAQTSYQDPHPLPQDTMTMATPEIGRHGGRFVIAQTSAPRTFNGIMANESSSTDLTSGRLFTTVADFDYVSMTDKPLLAKSWEHSADGLTTTFHLRRGARFSDGHPITSADLMFSVAVIYDSLLHPSMQDLLKSDGKPFEFTAPDSYTVVVKTAAPSAMIVPIIGSINVMPRHILEPAFRSGRFASAYGVSTPPESIVTSGPFRVKQYVAGEKTVLGRNPYWFGVDAKGQRLPYIDDLVFLIVPDQEAATLKFNAGEVDALDNVKPEDYANFEARQKSDSFTLYDLGPALSTNFFFFNLNTVNAKKPKKLPPGKKIGDPVVDPVKYSWFRQRDFRRALSMAVNREDMIKGPFHGHGVKNWSTTTPGNKTWHTPELTAPDYNPEESKRLLAGLGYKDRNGDGVLEDGQGRTISFTMKTNGDNKVRMALVNFVRDDLQKVGVRVVPTGVDFNTLVTNIREDFQYESILLGLQSGVPPDPGMSQNVYRSSGPTHYWNIRQLRPETPAEARLDQLMDENLRTLDLAGRKRTWREMQQIANDESWFIWLPTTIVKVPIRNKFGNLQPSVIPHRIIWNIDRVFVKQPGRPA